MDRRLAIALGLFVAGCGATSCGGKAPGLECAGDSECRMGSTCVRGTDDRGRCMEPCDGTRFLCEDGTLCLDRGADGRLCWFGGRTAFGTACEETAQCEAGTVCVAGAAQSTCEQACEPADDRICREGTEVCVAIAGVPNAGSCQPAPPETDGGAADAGVPGSAATTP